MDMYSQTYIIKTVNSHVEVYDGHNMFIESADNYDEAIKDLENGEV